MLRERITTCCVITTVLGMTAAALAGDTALGLDEGFRHPPDSARPWVYWFWMDGNSSREGVTADLEAMQRAGIGGVLMLEVDTGTPKGPVKFMSPAWRDMFKHAATEAARLGLEIDLNASPGWTGTGGPWIKPEQSMQKVVFSETNVTGPQRFEGPLAQPPAKEGFYRDVAVVAVPSPAGAFRIAGIADKAMFHRNFYWAGPGAPAYVPVGTEGPAPGDAIVPRDRIVDLAANLDAEGQLAWDVPAGNWTVIRFGRTSTGAKTIPAPESGIGLECDKMDAAAMDTHFEAYLGKLIADLGPLAGKSLVSVHIDSWEIGPQNWTGKFREEFQRRRGYDLVPFLPAVTGRVVESLEVSERFLWDMRWTISELIVENNGRRLADLAHRHGLKFSIEAYDGTPCDDLTYGASADVPMCEFWTNSIASWFSAVEAASIAHTNGRRIVAAEAFTANDAERWQFHPGSIKAVGDWAFCQGVNRFAIHRYAHQPWQDRWPGMTMGPWGLHFERTQTWWDMAPAFLSYVARCQYLLQQGLPVADICYMTPEGSPNVFRMPAFATRGDPPDHLGYNFDGCSPDVVMTSMSVKDGRLVLPDGMSYRILALPQTRTMTPKLLRKIEELVRAGATVVGAPPRMSPSLSDYPRCDDDVKALVKQLWGDDRQTSQPVNERRHGQGRVIWETRADRRLNQQPPATAPAAETLDANHAEKDLYCDYEVIARVLADVNVPPDFHSDVELSHVHRRVDGVDIYFVANRTDRPIAAECAFRVTGKTPEVWDPMSGGMKPPLAYQAEANRTLVPLWLDPNGSVFVIFRKAAVGPDSPADPVVAASRNGESLLPTAGRTLSESPVIEPLNDSGRGSRNAALLAWREGRYELRTAAGKIRQLDVPAIPPPMNVGGGWEVLFQPKRGAPDKITLDALTDWSKHADPGVRHFSGIATYRKELTIPSELTSKSRRVFLDLGKVEVAARVSLNGRDVGTLWKAPFRLDITDAIRPGANSLEIAVANLWPNRLIGDAALPEDRRIAWTTWNPFSPDTPLLPSGLLGPVTVLTAQIVEPH